MIECLECNLRFDVEYSVATAPGETLDEVVNFCPRCGCDEPHIADDSPFKSDCEREDEINEYEMWGPEGRPNMRAVRG